MKNHLKQCLVDFTSGWKLLKSDRDEDSMLRPEKIDLDFQYAPHKRPEPLRKKQRAIYVFFKDDQWLRIGQTDYSTRFTSQHYGTRRAGSTLAKDIRDHGSEFGFKGSDDEIGEWIFHNCGRANLRLPEQGAHPKACEYFAKLIESYLHYRLDPRFEGRRVRRKSVA